MTRSSGTSIYTGPTRWFLQGDWAAPEEDPESTFGLTRVGVCSGQSSREACGAGRKTQGLFFISSSAGYSGFICPWPF